MGFRAIQKMVVEPIASVQTMVMVKAENGFIETKYIDSADASAMSPRPEFYDLGHCLKANVNLDQLNSKVK